MVFDRVAEEDDPLAQQARVDVVGAFPPAGGLDDHGNEHRWTPLVRHGCVARCQPAAAGSLDVGVASDSGRDRGGGRLRLLDMGQRRVVRVGGQPVVDQLLDQTAPAQRAADEAPARGRTRSTPGDAGRPRSARGPARPRPRWPRREPRRPSSSAIFDSTRSVLTRFSAFGRKSAWRSASVFSTTLR